MSPPVTWGLYQSAWEMPGRFGSGLPKAFSIVNTAPCLPMVPLGFGREPGAAVDNTVEGRGLHIVGVEGVRLGSCRQAGAEFRGQGKVQGRHRFLELVWVGGAHQYRGHPG